MASPKKVVNKKGGKKVGKKGEKKEKKPATVRGKKIRGNRTRKSFNGAIKKVVGKSSKSPISGKGVKVLNSFAHDMLDRIALAAAGVARACGKRTLSAKAATTAVRMVLPAELAKHSTSEASKAAAAYAKATPKPVSKKGASKPKKSKK